MPLGDRLVMSVLHHGAYVWGPTLGAGGDLAFDVVPRGAVAVDDDVVALATTGHMDFVVGPVEGGVGTGVELLV